MVDIAGGNKKDLYPRLVCLDKGLADDSNRPRPGSCDRLDGLGAGHVPGRWLLPFVGKKGNKEWPESQGEIIVSVERE